MRFRDTVALVAGGTGALGRSVSLAFLSEGARVIVLGRDAASFALLADAAGEHRDRLTFTQVDLARSPEGERAVKEAVRAEGRLDAVVNAVGGWGGGLPLGDEPADLLERMLAMNLRAGYALARAAISLLTSQKGGAFVEVGSRAAIGPQPRQASYAASKAAALSLFLSLAEEVKRDGVRVNVVLPATLDTEANRRAMPGADRSTWVSTEDVARVILFLCSEDASAVTGAAIPVYGRA
jgi:NAD(P)-dependent dehydrogenase (short-subunit alcohol dehydrogenase family)